MEGFGGSGSDSNDSNVEGPNGPRSFGVRVALAVTFTVELCQVGVIGDGQRRAKVTPSPPAAVLAADDAGCGSGGNSQMDSSPLPGTRLFACPSTSLSTRLGYMLRGLSVVRYRADLEFGTACSGAGK